MLLLAKIGQCDEESYGWYGDNNIDDLLVFSGLFLIINFIVLFIILRDYVTFIINQFY